MFSAVSNPIKCEFFNIDSSVIINKIARKKSFKLFNLELTFTEIGQSC